MTVDLSISLGDVSFKNPVFVASGTFGYGTETNDLVDVSQLGAIVTKSIQSIRVKAIRLHGLLKRLQE